MAEQVRITEQMTRSGWPLSVRTIWLLPFRCFSRGRKMEVAWWKGFQEGMDMFDESEKELVNATCDSLPKVWSTRSFKISEWRSQIFVDCLWWTPTIEGVRVKPGKPPNYVSLCDDDGSDEYDEDVRKDGACSHIWVLYLGTSGVWC